MSRKSQYFIHKTVGQGKKIDVKIIVAPHRRLIDSDFPSQIRGRGNDHGIASAALDRTFKVSHLFLRIAHGRKHPTNMGILFIDLLQ